MTQPGPDFTKPQYPTDAGYTPPPLQSGVGYGGAPNDTDRGIAVLTHLAAIIAWVLSAGTVGFLGPLVVWFLYKDKNPFVRQAAAGAFNFNLWATVVYYAGWLAFFTVIGIPVAVLMWAASFILTLVFSLVGAARANRGEAYHYPFQIKILS